MRRFKSVIKYCYSKTDIFDHITQGEEYLTKNGNFQSLTEKVNLFDVHFSSHQVTTKLSSLLSILNNLTNF